MEKSLPLELKSSTYLSEHFTNNSYDTVQDSMSTSHLINSEHEKVTFHHHEGSCKFRLEVESRESDGRMSKRDILSTQYVDLRIAQDGEEQNQFIRVGLGNIDFIPVIEDGDVQ